LPVEKKKKNEKKEKEHASCCVSYTIARCNEAEEALQITIEDEHKK
jgi:hypothetical protein